MSYSLPSGVFRTRIIFLDSNYYFLDCPIGVNLRKPDIFFIFIRLIFPGNLFKCSIPGAFLTKQSVGRANFQQREFNTKVLLNFSLGLNRVVERNLKDFLCTTITTARFCAALMSRSLRKTRLYISVFRSEAPQA